MPSADLPVHPNQLPRLVSRSGVRLREDTLYTDQKGEEKKRFRERADNALDKLEEPLRKMLEMCNPASRLIQER